MKQKTLVDGEARKNAYHIYSKKVKDNKINGSIISKSTNKRKLLELINSLLKHGGKKDIEDLEIDENCRDWVANILNGFPSFDMNHLKYLLNDFTDNMMTRMREEDKYAVTIISPDILLLCHAVAGERTITPTFKFIERMLDTDNVERFVVFQKKNDSIEVTYWEHYPSESFIRWLGITQKEAFFYLGGKNRFHSDLDGLNCVIELTDEDVENNFIKNDSFRFENSTLILPSGNRLNISQIRVGKKYFDNYENFLENFMHKRYNLNYYSEQYAKINSSLEPLYKKFIDEKDKLIKIEKSVEKISIRKYNSNFIILFGNNNVSFRQNFLEELFTDFLNNKKLKIFHAGVNFSSEPLEVGVFSFYNKFNLDSSIQSIIKYYNGTSIKDRDIFNILSYLAFYLLKQKNKDLPICNFFKLFSEKFIHNLDLKSKIIQQEDRIIEFKSRDVFVGNDNEIVKKLIKDIRTKTATSDFKIYFIGCDEELQNFETINGSRLPSDRISSIENKIQKELDSAGSFDVNLIKIPLKSKECILVLAVKKLK
jgi:hypothetical protein